MPQPYEITLVRFVPFVGQHFVRCRYFVTIASPVVDAMLLAPFGSVDAVVADVVSVNSPADVGVATTVSFAALETGTVPIAQFAATPEAVHGLDPSRKGNANDHDAELTVAL